MGNAVRIAATMTAWATAALAYSGAWAQTPSVVPQSSELAPPRLQPDAKGQTPVPPSAPPPRELGKPEDDVRIDIKRFEVDDNAPAELRQALGELTDRFVGQGRGFEDLVSATAEVTRFLQRDLGYYLGYAYLPEQAPNNGVIRIAVLEGRLDRVVLNWTDGLPVDRDVVEAYLARLEPGSILKVRDVERIVFLVNDLRGITARFEVKAGSKPGTAILVVTPRAESVWSGKVEGDLNGSRFLGQYRLGGLLQMSSPFGRGDGLTANALVSTTRGLGFGLLGYTTPVGSDGFKLGASLSAVRYQLDKEVFPLNLNGTAVTLNAYGLYPLIRSRNLNIFNVLSAEHKVYDDKQEAANTHTQKSVDTLALGATGDFRDSLLGGGVNTYDATVTSGSVKYPDGRPGGLDDAPSFAKLTFGFSRLQDILTGRLLGYLSLRGQYTSKNLDTTEQFRIGGPEGVRAFATGEGTGDSGAVMSLEMRFLPPEDWLGRVARDMVASFFVDYGAVRYRMTPKPSTNPGTQANNDTFAGVGLGLSYVMPNEYALRFSVSSPVSGTPRSDTVKRNPRLYLLASKLFN
jgi:hemolysin activation/secretion protein